MRLSRHSSGIARWKQEQISRSRIPPTISRTILWWGDRLCQILQKGFSRTGYITASNPIQQRENGNIWVRLMRTKQKPCKITVWGNTMCKQHSVVSVTNSQEIPVKTQFPSHRQRWAESYKKSSVQHLTLKIRGRFSLIFSWPCHHRTKLLTRSWGALADLGHPLHAMVSPVSSS